VRSANAGDDVALACCARTSAVKRMSQTGTRLGDLHLARLLPPLPTRPSSPLATRTGRVENTNGGALAFGASATLDRVDVGAPEQGEGCAGERVAVCDGRGSRGPQGEYGRYELHPLSPPLPSLPSPRRRRCEPISRIEERLAARRPARGHHHGYEVSAPATNGTPHHRLHREW